MYRTAQCRHCLSRLGAGAWSGTAAGSASTSGSSTARLRIPVASTSTAPQQRSAVPAVSGVRYLHRSARRSLQAKAFRLQHQDEATVPRIRSAGELYDVSAKKGRRVTLKSQDMAKRIAKAITKDKQKMTVLDLYPGNGTLSRALLDIPEVEAVVAAEMAPQYRAELDNLLEENAGRFQYVSLDPFWWDAYSVMQEREYLSQVPKIPWEQPHNGLALVGCIPNSINGEKLVVQQLSCIPEAMWLYDYGRFTSYYLITKQFATRLTAPPGSKARHKVAVMMEAIVNMEVIVPSDDLKPANKYFARHGGRSPVASATTHCLLKCTPKHRLLFHTQEELEALEFLARNLFIHGARKWIKSLKYLAPGADILPKMVEQAGGHIDPDKTPRQMTIEEWIMLTKAFLAWPFRPKDLEQSDLRDAANYGDD